MTTSTVEVAYSIKEVAALTGLPASTLRYYESVGVIDPVERGESSGHRLYDANALDQITWLACLAATGMSIAGMREYVANSHRGAASARDQIALLAAQQRRIEVEAEQLALRQRYIALKIDYWKAVEAGNQRRAQNLSRQAAALGDEIKRHSH